MPLPRARAAYLMRPRYQAQATPAPEHRMFFTHSGRSVFWIDWWRNQLDHALGLFTPPCLYTGRVPYPKYSTHFLGQPSRALAHSLPRSPEQVAAFSSGSQSSLFMPEFFPFFFFFFGNFFVLKKFETYRKFAKLVQGIAICSLPRLTDRSHFNPFASSISLSQFTHTHFRLNRWCSHGFYYTF